jgi:hypothetical protein
LSVPDQIDLVRHRDLAGRTGVWFRRLVILCLLALVVLALINTFCQRPSVSVARSGGASLSVRAPTRLRGGLIYEVRFEIRAKQTLQNAALVLGAHWLEGMTLNTLEPSPASETSADGQLRFSLGRIQAGHTFTQFIQLQVNPTTVAHRAVEASLFAGTRRLVTIRRTVTIFP